MKRTLFFVSKFASYHLVINIYPIFPMIPSTLVRDRYRKHVSTWLNICFLSRKCVCMCVYVCHYFIIRSSHITFLTIHIYVWYDLIRSTLCVCVSNSQGKKSIERNAVRVYCAWRGLKFRVSTYCILYFSTVYCSEGREKNIWRKYTVREVDFRVKYTIRTKKTIAHLVSQKYYHSKISPAFSPLRRRTFNRLVNINSTLLFQTPLQETP